MYSVIPLLLLAACLGARAYMPNYLVVTRQTAADVGYVETMDGESGAVKLSSNVSFSFRWPYVQMNTNTQTNIVYVLTIPSSNVPQLYAMQSTASGLKQMQLFTLEDGTIIFDLQSSETKNTLFGIKVTGQYQRTLSNIVPNGGGKMYITELYDLPEYWYVNASSYDGKSDVYYALINNFPGRPESTLAQQLLMVDFSDTVVRQATPKPPGVLLPVVDKVFGGQLQFIAFSLRFVFAAGINLQTNVAYVTLVDPVSGETSDLGFSVPHVTEVGPLVVHSNHGTTSVPMNLFVKYGTNGWMLYELMYNTNAGVITVIQQLQTYSGEDYKYFAAATVAFNEN